MNLNLEKLILDIEDENIQKEINKLRVSTKKSKKYWKSRMGVSSTSQSLSNEVTYLYTKNEYYKSIIKYLVRDEV